MEYTKKDLKCCDNMVECEYCPNCKQYFNEKIKTALELHRLGKCKAIMRD